MIRGVVRSIDRTMGFVQAELQNRPGRLTPAAYQGEPPDLLSFCLFDQDGPSWRFDSQLSSSRVVLHDDFQTVDAVFGYGEGPWRAVDPGGGGLINASGTMDGAVGHVRIRSSATSGQETYLAKTDESIVVPDEKVLLFSARFQLNQTTSVRYRIGLANDEAANDAPPGISTGSGVYLSADTSLSANFELVCAVSGVATTLELPVPIDTGVHIVDLAIAGGNQPAPGTGDWAACWLDGDGPYTVLLSVPAQGDAGIEPFLYVEPLSANQRVMLVDWVHVELLDLPFAHPTEPLIPELEAIS